MERMIDCVLFGASGDLALSKLIPSIYRCTKEGHVSLQSRLFFCARSQSGFENMHKNVKDALYRYLQEEEKDEKAMAAFLDCVIPIQVDITDKSSFKQLKSQLTTQSNPTRVFYLAIPPGHYAQVARVLHDQQLITESTRLVVEKPIGSDLTSSESINDALATVFSEQQIFRIDHYLGKETVQNLLAMRFGNSLFERFWDADAIDHIQISINERVGVKGRVDYYEGIGALKDMVQNHLLQLLCLIAMESPNELTPESIHREKIKVLKALRPLTGESVNENTVRAQYVAGGQNNQMESGYLEDTELSESTTETFVAIKAHINSWTWSKVPFYLRTGKRLSKQRAEIVIQFKDVALSLYPEQQLQANRLVIQLQPEERLRLHMMAKDRESLSTELKPVVLDLNFLEQKGSYRSFAYKRLFLDAVDGNRSLFMHRDEVAAAWQWIDPIATQWNKTHDLHLYRAGTDGPEAADGLINADGRAWFESE
ncbi:MAG: glucose-6-phosphate dehydrogenase [Cellvibrionales bacterium]|nr:glucose-6-phosphate dehydrogenase [Cellvibrionales bacterium]